MTDTLTPNLPELKRLNMWVHEQDKLEPGARIWDQGNWVELREETPMCQTAYCVAGMAIVRAGHVLRSKETPDPDCVCCSEWQYFLDNEEISDTKIRYLGAELLGLNSDTAAYLFRGGNSAFDIDCIIRGVFDRAGAGYDATEPAPDLEIEIKAAEAVRPQLLPTLTNA